MSRCGAYLSEFINIPARVIFFLRHIRTFANRYEKLPIATLPKLIGPIPHRLQEQSEIAYQISFLRYLMSGLKNVIAVVGPIQKQVDRIIDTIDGLYTPGTWVESDGYLANFYKDEPLRKYDILKAAVDTALTKIKTSAGKNYVPGSTEAYELAENEKEEIRRYAAVLIEIDRLIANVSLAHHWVFPLDLVFPFDFQYSARVSANRLSHIR